MVGIDDLVPLLEVADVDVLRPLGADLGGLL